MATKQQLLHLDHRLPSVSPGGRHRVPREGRPRRSVPAPTSLPSCRPDPGRLRCTVDIQSDDAHAPSVPVRSKREPAGNTTSTDPPSRRIRESRKGRPCNELGLSAHCLLTAYPHLRAPGAPCPRWAHHIAVSLSETGGQQGAANHIPDNGKVERFHKTALD